VNLIHLTAERIRFSPYGLFYDAVSISHYDYWWIKKWKRFRGVHGLRYYSSICLQELRKIIKNLRISSDPAEIETEYPPNNNLGVLLLYHSAWWKGPLLDVCDDGDESFGSIKEEICWITELPHDCSEGGNHLSGFWKLTSHPFLQSSWTLIIIEFEESVVKLILLKASHLNLLIHECWSN
jgi:hypothetical protein